MTLTINDSNIKSVALQPDHLKELLEKRDLPLSWIEENCTTIDAETATKRLGYKVQSGGIWLQGKGEQGQFKPDEPFTDKTGRIAKYVTPKSKYDAVVPRLPDGAVWDPIKINGHPCLIITEGIFKAIYASAVGIPTIALMGVEMGLTPAKDDPEERRFLVPTLAELAKKKYGFIFAFDADIASKEGVKAAQRRLAYALKVYEVPLYEIPVWDEEKGKGIDDFIQNQGIEAFNKLVKSAKPYEIIEKKYKKLSTGKLWDFLCKTFAGRVFYNDLEKKVYLDGQSIDCEDIWMDLLIYHQIEVTGVKNAEKLFVKLAKETTVDPVKNYLESVFDCVQPLEDIDHLATRYLGIEASPYLDYYNKFLKWMLIGAVARIYNPGCEFHGCVVLNGDYGLGKTTFYKTLAGQWYDASMQDVSNKDDLLILHQCWFEEWGEIERITGKEGYGKVKNFITRNRDTFRVPYGSETKGHPRRSIIVGSANDDQFLAETDRRFWPIPVTKRINIPLLQKERDALWSAAVKAYKNGESYAPSFEEEREIIQMSDKYRIHDEWETLIADYLDHPPAYVDDKPACWVDRLAQDVLGFDGSFRIEKHVQMRIGKILQRLGWGKVGQRKIEVTDPHKGTIEKRVHLWQPKEKEVQNYQGLPEIPAQPQAPAQPQTRLRSEVETAEPLTVSSPAQPQLPAQPQIEKNKNSHFSEPPNFSTYPDRPTNSRRQHRIENSTRAKEKRANKLKDVMVACSTRSELNSLRQSYSGPEIRWVYTYLLSQGEKGKVGEAASLEQPNLLEARTPINIQSFAIATEINEKVTILGESWTPEMELGYFLESFGKSDRSHLTDEELRKFLEFLTEITTN